MPERYRYVGPDASRMLALPGGGLEFPQGEWVDPEQLCADAHIPLHHLEIVLPGLGEDFERESAPKSKGRKHAAEDAAPEADDKADEAEKEQA